MKLIWLAVLCSALCGCGESPDHQDDWAKDFSAWNQVSEIYSPAAGSGSDDIIFWMGLAAVGLFIGALSFWAKRPSA